MTFKTLNKIWKYIYSKIDLKNNKILFIREINYILIDLSFYQMFQ